MITNDQPFAQLLVVLVAGVGALNWGLIVTAVTIYRCARTLSCGRPGTDLQRSL
ncbi:MAG: hypothetical protein V5A34_01680 [Halapricum sp.]